MVAAYLGIASPFLRVRYVKTRGTFWPRPQARAEGLHVDSRMRVALISALGRAGRMREAMEQLEAMGMGEGGPGWNVFALNAGLAATAVYGEWRVAEAVWRRLIADGVKPDTISYRCIAVASSLATEVCGRSRATHC